MGAGRTSSSVPASTQPLSSTSRLPWLVAFLALSCWGCNDNVTCVFTDGCIGGPPIGENPAFLPVDGDWIIDGPPKMVVAFPEGLENSGTTPVVVVFSESMQAESLEGAIEIVPLVGGGLPGTPVTGLSEQLVGDGRVLVLLPSVAVPLPSGDYLIRLSEQALALDLTGQALDLEPAARIGNFTVAVTPPTVPQLVMTYPLNGTEHHSETTQLVAVFDRPVLATSVNGASFDVRVEGVDPPNDPTAVPAVTGDTRAFVYRSVDGNGQPVPLGTGVDVELRLSPAGAPISEPDGDDLDPATSTFRTLLFETPISASLLSDPSDAIGLFNLTDGNAEELQVEVELDGLETNDVIDLFLFGEQKSIQPDPPLIALQRSVRLTAATPVLSVIFEREDVGLQFTNTPDDVRFNDGPVTFAFRVRRLAIETPVRVLDLDPNPATIRDPILDTVAPEVLSLVGSTGTDTFRSEMRGLSLSGLVATTERLRSVEVSTLLGNNPPLAPVVGAGEGAGGAFLAAPVPLGIVTGGGTTYSFVARDTAQNASTALAGTYTQLGVVGPDPIVLGQPITIEVFDSRTFALLQGALVMVHSDDGAAFPLVQSGFTLADGTISLITAGAPSAGAIVTVVLPGYDLFTLHGVPSSRLSIPLRRSQVSRARAAGVVETSDPAAAAFLGGLDKRLDDSRRRVELPRGFVSQSCTGTTELDCPYGPESIQERKLGARSFYAGDFLQDNELTFSAGLLLQAFALSVPLAPVAEGGLQNADLEVRSLLSDPNAAPEDAVLALPVFTFQVDAGSGVDQLAPANDPSTTGAPFAGVEVLVPGLTGAIGVSQALSYSQASGLWTVRGALPGAVTAAGSLGSEGVVETDPFVRVELADPAGNTAGVRPRLSQILAGGANPVFRALGVPTQLTPAQGAQSGGQAFTLLLTHAIGDERSLNGKGLYRVELSDKSGRGWTLWRFDPSGAAAVPVRVVDPADAGGTGLADGNLQSSVAAFAWGALVPNAFLWSDVEREFELFSRAASLSFAKP